MGARLKKLMKMSKNPKLQSDFGNQAECDGVRSQSAHEINQKRGEPGLKTIKG
jgi:hypothetical protein